MLTQIQKLAVQSIADPDELVILTNISEGVEGATLFGITEESPDPLKIEDDQTVQQRFRHTVNIRGLYDSTDMAQLRTWSGSQTKVRLSGYTVDGFVLFNGDYLLSPNAQFDSVNVTALMVTVEWLGNFSSGYRQIHIGENGLRNYDVLAGASTLLYGSTADAGITPTLSGDDQTITYASGAGNGWRSGAIFFPFEGLTLTASANITSATGTMGWQIGLAFYVEDGTTIISTSITAYDGGSVPARVSHSTTVPTGTFFIKMVVLAGSDQTPADSTTFHSPCIRVGTGTTYTNW